MIQLSALQAACWKQLWSSVDDPVPGRLGSSMQLWASLFLLAGQRATAAEASEGLRPLRQGTQRCAADPGTAAAAAAEETGL